MPTHIIEEQRAFDGMRDRLAQGHAGQAVLFKDGDVVEYFADTSAAFEAGVKRYGLQGGFLISAIQPVPPARIALELHDGLYAAVDSCSGPRHRHISHSRIRPHRST